MLVEDDLQEIRSTTTLLDQAFKIKDLGNLTYFLGLEVARNAKGIHLSQRKYAINILQETDMLASTPVSTLMNFSKCNSTNNGDGLSDPTSYRRLIGKLIYLTNTRPDIMHVVHNLSQYVLALISNNHQAALLVLRYLKQAPRLGLFLDANSDIKITGFSYSNWVRCLDMRKSITRFIIYLGQSPINWKSKKQCIVSHSSSEVEYRALASTTCELQWILYVLQDLKIQHPQPALLFCDN